MQLRDARQRKVLMSVLRDLKSKATSNYEQILKDLAPHIQLILHLQRFLI